MEKLPNGDSPAHHYHSIVSDTEEGPRSELWRLLTSKLYQWRLLRCGPDVANGRSSGDSVDGLLHLVLSPGATANREKRSTVVGCNGDHIDS